MINYPEAFQVVNEALTEAGGKYADAKEQRARLDKFEKSVLSDLMKRFEGSMASREMEARASQEFKNHLEGLAVAIGEEARTKVKYDNLVIKYESYRTLASLEKAQMNLI